MYPLHCHAGFAMPISTGKFSICAVAVKPEDETATLELQLWDTGSNNVVDPDSPPVDGRRIFHHESDDAAGIFVSFPEPLKVRSGISVGAAANLDGGTLYVYVR